MTHADVRPDLAFGQTSPPLGWISHRFDEKCASPTFVWRERIVGTQTFTTQLAIRIA